MAEKIIIIGNGISAVTALKAIREYDSESEIHVFGEERFYPYNRIRLSKGLLNALEEDKILLQKKEWYEVNNIKLHQGIKVRSINTEERTVTDTAKRIYHYTKLLIACGAQNFIPPVSGIDKEGVYTLRTLEDAWRITASLKAKKTILNIGGGIQGLETAWILSQMEKKIVIAELLPRLMPKQLDKRASQILEKAVNSFGIEIMTSTQINSIEGRDKVEGFRAADNVWTQCDMVLYSAGIKPNLDLLNNTPIHVNKGIVVNERMETTLKDIYAAGDIAEYQGELFGLWNIAIGQGKAAGYNIAGKETNYERIVPVTTLNAFNLSLFSMGIVEEETADYIIVEDHSEKGIYNKAYIKNNQVIGAIVIGNTKYSPLLKTSIENKIDLSGINFKQVSFDELLETIRMKK